jgi:hypothetical protein
VFTTLAAMRMQQGRFREAAEALEAAARVGGTTPGLTAQIGFARIGNQQSEQGLALLRQAFEQNPGQLQVGTALATLHLRRAMRPAPCGLPKPWSGTCPTSPPPTTCSASCAQRTASRRPHAAPTPGPSRWRRRCCRPS